MVFPATALDIRVQVALDSPDLSAPTGWVWTDATSYVKIGDGITITIGRRDQYSQMPPSTLALNVRNSDGRWTRTNPTGAWYGRLGRNTPIRVQVNNGSGYTNRFTGTIDAFPPRWDYTGRYAVAQITASGALRRAEKRGSTRSALFRASTRGYYSSGTAVAYWPCEDASGATSIASGISGHPAAVFSGADFTLAADSTIAGSDPLPTIGVDGTLRCPVPAYPTATTWAIRAVMKLPTSASGTLLYWGTPTGSGNIQWALSLGSGTDLVTISAINTAGTDVIADPGVTLTGIRGQQLYIYANATQSGANINWDYGIQWGSSGGGGRVGTLNSATVGNVTQVHVYNVAPTALGAATIGHIAVATSTTYGNIVNGATGYAREATGTRGERLSLELTLPWNWSLNATTLMGVQPTDTTIGQLREIGAAEGVPIYDALDGRLYLPARADRYNQAVALSLSFTGSQIQPPQPTDDDQYIRNDITVSRLGGSSARRTQRTGVNSISVGSYEDSATLNVAADTDLPFRADWLRHLGTVDELRYPNVDINMASRGMTTTKIDNWLLCAPGSRMQLTSPGLPGLAPDTVDLLIEGWSEFLRYPREWRASLNCSPATPWSVFQLEDDSLGRLDTEGSILTAAAASGATPLTVATTSGPLWSTTAVPYDVGIAGEKVTVTAVANAVRDTFTRSVSSGWGTTDSGQSWVIGAGTASLFTATGSVGQIAVSALNTEHHIALNLAYAPYQRVRAFLTLGVTPTGAPINWGVVLRRTDASNLYWIDVQVGTDSVLTLRAISKIAGVNTQLATAVSKTVHSTSSARVLVAEIDAANIIRAKVYDSGAAEPGWELSYDASAVVGLSTGPSVGCIARLATGNTNVGPVNFQFDNFAVLNPQEFTVTRSVNGVVKAQLADAAVSDWRPGEGGLAL